MPRIKTNADIPDIQNTTDGFPNKYIPKVGTRDATLPVKIIRKDGTVNEGSVSSVCIPILPLRIRVLICPAIAS
jgi:hypothetical protein